MPNLRRTAFLRGNDKLLQSRVRKTILKREDKEMARKLIRQRKKLKTKRLREKSKVHYCL